MMLRSQQYHWKRIGRRLTSSALSGRTRLFPVSSTLRDPSLDNQHRSLGTFQRGQGHGDNWYRKSLRTVITDLKRELEQDPQDVVPAKPLDSIKQLRQVLEWRATVANVNQAFSLLNQLVLERKSPQPQLDFGQLDTSLLNSLVFKWRDCWKEKQKSNREITSSNTISELLYPWNLLNKMEGYQESFPGMLPNTETYNAVLAVANLNHTGEDPYQVAVFVQSVVDQIITMASPQEELQPNAETYNLLVQAWARAGKMEKVHKILQSLEQDVQMNQETLSAISQASVAQLEAISKLNQELQLPQVIANNNNNAMVEALKEAQEELPPKVKTSIPTSHPTVPASDLKEDLQQIQQWIETGSQEGISKAFEQLGKMILSSTKHKNIHIPSNLVSDLVHCWRTSWKQNPTKPLPYPTQVITKVLKYHDAQNGFQLDTRAYNALIMALGNELYKEKASQWGQHIWEHMQRQDRVVPDSITYDRMIKVHAKAGNVQGALDLIRLACDSPKIHLMSDSFLLVLYAIEGSQQYWRAQEAMDLMARYQKAAKLTFKKRGRDKLFILDKIHNLANLCREKSGHPQATQTINTPQHPTRSPDSENQNFENEQNKGPSSAAGAAIQPSEGSKAQLHKETAITAASDPNQDLAQIRQWIKEGSQEGISKAFAQLDRMMLSSQDKELHIPKGIVDDLVHRWRKCWKQKPTELLPKPTEVINKVMQYDNAQNGFQPNSYTYNALIMALYNEQDEEMASQCCQHLWEHMQQQDGVPDSLTYYRAIKIHAKAGHVQRSMDLIRMALNTEVRLSVDSFLLAMHAIEEGKQYWMAQEVMDLMALNRKLERLASNKKLRQDNQFILEKIKKIAIFCQEKLAGSSAEPGKIDGAQDDSFENQSKWKMESNKGPSMTGGVPALDQEVFDAPDSAPLKPRKPDPFSASIASASDPPNEDFQRIRQWLEFQSREGIFKAFEELDTMILFKASKDQIVHIPNDLVSDLLGVWRMGWRRGWSGLRLPKASDVVSRVLMYHDWQNGFRLDNSTYNQLIGALNNDPDREAASRWSRHLFDRMQQDSTNSELDIAPNSMTYDRLIRLHAQADNVEKALDFIRGAIDAKVLLSADSFLLVMYALDRSKQWQMAEEVLDLLDQLRKADLLILKADHHLLPVLDKIDNQAARCKENLEKHPGSPAFETTRELETCTIELEPTQASFNDAIKEWEQKGDLIRVDGLQKTLFQLYQSGLDATLQPTDASSYNFCTHAWMDSSHPQFHHRAMYLLRDLEMYSANNPENISFQSTTAIYNFVLRCLVNAGDAHWAESLLQKMHREADGSGNSLLQPTTLTYNAVMKAWGNNNDSRDAGLNAERLLKRMYELHLDGVENVLPDTDTYNSTLLAWANSGHLEAGEAAQRLFKDMRGSEEESGRPQVEPDSFTFHYMVQAFANSGNIDQAEQLLLFHCQEYLDGKTQVAPSRRTFPSLLNSCAESARSNPKAADRAASLLREMRKLNGAGMALIRPDVIDYSSAMKAYANSYPSRGDAAEHVQLIWDDMVEKGIAPDRISYLILLRAWALPGNSEKSETILRNLVEDYKNRKTTVKPNIECFHLVLDSYLASEDAQAGPQADSLLEWMEELNREGLVPDLQPDYVSYRKALKCWERPSCSLHLPHAQTRIADLVAKVRQVKD